MVGEAESETATSVAKPSRPKKAAASDPFADWFRRAVEFEGKVNEDVPGDNGGPTRWGITLGRLASVRGVKTPKRGTAAFESLKADLYALSEDQIREIYRRDYWEAVRADELPPGLSLAVADFALNSGPARAVKALQKALGNPQTGVMEEETLGEANAYERVDLIMLYQAERQRFLNAIVDSRPNQRKFLRGWTQRVDDVRRAAIATAEKAPEPEPVALAAMPKAEAPAPPNPTVVGEASRSWSVRILLGMIGTWISDAFFGVTEWVSHALDWIVMVARDTAAETAGALMPLASLAGTLKLNLGRVTIWLGVAFLVIVLARHVKDKVDLAKLKQQLPPTPAPRTTP